jgi:hypothetical protein
MEWSNTGRPLYSRPCAKPLKEECFKFDTTPFPMTVVMSLPLPDQDDYRAAHSQPGNLQRIMLNLLERSPWILFMPKVPSVYYYDPKGIFVCSNTQKYELCEYGVGGVELVRTVVLRIPIRYLLVGTSEVRSSPRIQYSG